MSCLRTSKYCLIVEASHVLTSDCLPAKNLAIISRIQNGTEKEEYQFRN